MSGRLAGKRALVTGAASGIGRATALRFAAEGAKVLAVDRDEQGLDGVLADLLAQAPDAQAQRADVSLEGDVAHAVDTALARWDGLDVLVANAAVQLFGQDAHVHELELDVWQRTMAVNLTGAFLTCKHGLRALLAAGGGSVVCIGSPTGLRGNAPQFAAYSTSKAGIVGLARVIAASYARENVRANVVVPGFTDTGLIQSITSDPAAVARIAEAIPVGRPASPEEIASTVLFLASDEAAYATGGVFCVDGGTTGI